VAKDCLGLVLWVQLANTGLDISFIADSSGFSRTNKTIELFIIILSLFYYYFIIVLSLFYHHFITILSLFYHYFIIILSLFYHYFIIS